MRLDALLAQFVDLALRLGELLRIFCEKGVDGLASLLRQHLQGGACLGELAFLGSERGQLRLLRFHGVDHGGFRSGAAGKEISAHRHALAQRLDQSFLLAKSCDETALLLVLLHDLGIETF